jgi:hypothetical protein
MLGGVLALAGVTTDLLARVRASRRRAQHDAGHVFTVASVLLSSCGNLTASRNRFPRPAVLAGAWVRHAVAERPLCVVPRRCARAPELCRARRFQLVVCALLYLALAGSVLTFAVFLNPQERIGPGPTGLGSAR